jgi:hypothetical protein
MAQTLAVQDFLDRGAVQDDLLALLVATTDTSLQFANTGDILVFISNESGGAVNVTVEAAVDPFGHTVDVGPTSVADEKFGLISFMSPAVFNTTGTLRLAPSD